MVYSVTAPAVVIRPMRATNEGEGPTSANQRLPSGPAAMPLGALLAVMPVLNGLGAEVGRERGIGGRGGHLQRAGMR